MARVNTGDEALMANGYAEGLKQKSTQQTA